jgi:hypothetical protein
MNNRHRLTPTATALVTALFLVTGCGTHHTDPPVSHPAATAQATTPCPGSADWIDRYRQAHHRLPKCIRIRLAHHRDSEPAPCPVVADRIERSFGLGLVVPRCVRRLQHR